MTLNGYYPLFCVISPHSIALQADCVAVVEDRPKMNVRKISSCSYIWPKLTHAAVAEGVFANAELIVCFSHNL